MRRNRRRTAAALILGCAGAIAAIAQSISVPYGGADRDALYRRLLQVIATIKIFDNHGHPGYSDDPDVDAMVAPPGSVPLRLRVDNPELVAASKALFGYPYEDLTPKHAAWLIDKKAALKKNHATGYFDRILDQVGIETAVANRVAMPSYLNPHRFLWAFFVDSFLFPLNNEGLGAENADMQVYLPLQQKKLQRELKQAGLEKLPASFDDYLAFVSHIVESNKANGGVALKFEAAYFRSLAFADPPQEQAAAVYDKFAKGGEPTKEQYTVFQDFVFRHLLGEAARLHLPVQFHTSVGVGDFFNLHDGNILNLENVLRDPRYENVTFVLLHGGFPVERSAIWLTARKNVYLDTSLLDLELYPSEFKDVLKYFLSIYPDKVLFGSDAFPFTDAMGAEEAYWLSVQSSREALAAALAELVSEHAITETKALAIAHGYLHDNAARLYRSPL